MAEALSKELGLNEPTKQHGVNADQHVEKQNHPTTQKYEIDPLRDMEIVDPEKRVDRNRHSIDSYGLHRTQSGVDVERAEKDFAELSRELSSISRRISRTQSRASHPTAQDLEKAHSSSESTTRDAFDLEETLRGNREADDAAGIKSKYIGECCSRTPPSGS